MTAMSELGQTSRAMSASTPATDSLAIVAAVNNEEVLERNLMRSSIVQSKAVSVHCYRDQPSASIAYNRGLDDTSDEYIAFVHQDIYLPPAWGTQLNEAIATLNHTDPNWAVLGVCGITREGEYKGHVWSSGLGKLYGVPLSQPEAVVSIDEMTIVLRRSSGIRFDKNLPFFHLYGTDIIQIAMEKGLSAYVAEIPVIHNSVPVQSLKGGYTRAYLYMRRKWKAKLPIQTLILPVENSIYRLLRTRFRVFVNMKKKQARSVSSTTDPREISKKLGFE